MWSCFIFVQTSIKCALFYLHSGREQTYTSHVGKSCLRNGRQGKTGESEKKKWPCNVSPTGMVWIKLSIPYLGRTMRFRSSQFFYLQMEPAFSTEGYNNTSTGWDMWLDMWQGCLPATNTPYNILCICRCNKCWVHRLWHSQNTPVTCPITCPIL
jgi:hypothetical protein